MGRRDAIVIVLLCIFRNTLLNIRTSLNDFFIAECLFVRAMLLDLGICAAGKNKITTSDAPAVKLLQ